MANTENASLVVLNFDSKTMEGDGEGGKRSELSKVELETKDWFKSFDFRRQAMTAT